MMEEADKLTPQAQRECSPPVLSRSRYNSDSVLLSQSSLQSSPSLGNEDSSLHSAMRRATLPRESVRPSRPKIRVSFSSETKVHLMSRDSRELLDTVSVSAKEMEAAAEQRNYSLYSEMSGKLQTFLQMTGLIVAVQIGSVIINISICVLLLIAKLLWSELLNITGYGDHCEDLGDGVQEEDRVKRNRNGFQQIREAE